MKRIDGQNYLFIPWNDNFFSKCEQYRSTTNLYAVDVPPEADQCMRDAGFVQQDDLTLMKGTVLQSNFFVPGFCFQEESNAKEAVGVGESAHPLHLRHSYEELQELMAEPNGHLYSIRKNNGIVVGKMVVRSNNNIAFLHGLGIDKVWKGRGLGRDFVLWSIQQSGCQFGQGLMLPGSISFFQHLGFKEKRLIRHWLRVP